MDEISGTGNFYFAAFGEMLQLFINMIPVFPTGGTGKCGLGKEKLLQIQVE